MSKADWIPTVKRSITVVSENNDNNDINEFVPMTKRMNHLSIENGSDTNGSSSSHTSIPSLMSFAGADDIESCDSVYRYPPASMSASTTSSTSWSTDDGCCSNNSNSAVQAQHHSSNQPNHYQNDLMYLNEIYRTYNPPLALEQNPNYFEQNRILFEAHQMRLLRMQQHLRQLHQQHDHDNNKDLDQESKERVKRFPCDHNDDFRNRPRLNHNDNNKFIHKNNDD